MLFLPGRLRRRTTSTARSGTPTATAVRLRVGVVSVDKWPSWADPPSVVDAAGTPLVPPLETIETLDNPWWYSAVSLTDLDKMAFPPLKYVVERLVTVGGLVLLAGAPKSGKSLLALGCGLAVASGGKALGRLDVAKTDVLYISLDDQSQARAQRRIRDLLGDEPMPPGMTLHTEYNLGTGALATARISEYLDSHPRCGLVVIDTVEHLRGDRGAGVGVYSADVRFLSKFRDVLARHPDVAVLALAHTRKGDGDDDAVEAVSGTHGVSGGADALLVLTGKRGIPRRILDVVSRDDEDSRMVLSLTRHGLTVTDEDPDDPALMLSPDDARLYRALDQFTDGATAKDLGQAYPAISNIGDRLGRLARQGTVVRKARGVYST